LKSKIKKKRSKTVQKDVKPKMKKNNLKIAANSKNPET